VERRQLVFSIVSALGFDDGKFPGKKTKKKKTKTNPKQLRAAKAPKQAAVWGGNFGIRSFHQLCVYATSKK